MRLFNILLYVILSTVVLSSHADDRAKGIKLFNQAFEIIEKEYVTDIDYKKMFGAAINGALSSLDPHSTYLDEEEYKDLQDHTKGEFGGIGVEVVFENNAIKVVSPIEDLPAQKAGIKSEDLIIEVNGELVSNLGYFKAVKTMRGEPGTKVKLKVLSKDKNNPETVELTREIVKIKPVKSRLEENIAYLRVTTFNSQTTSDLKAALKELQAKSVKPIEGIILDLRNNPGGLLDQAIGVSEYFIDKGLIVSTAGRTPSSLSKVYARVNTTKAPNIPMVVIINGGSASASEIVAGALQDHKRAIVIGTQSYGKASVQSVIPLREGALKLTIAQYYTPSGRSIQAEGIVPDIKIEQPAKIEYAEERIERRFEGSLKNHLKNGNEKNSNTKAETEGKLNSKVESIGQNKSETKEESKSLSEEYKKDYQYARAFDLLKGLIISGKKNNNVKH